MRECLTYLAGAVVVLLTVALIGPWLIDWPAHRDAIEAQASRALGATVRTRGAIDLKLLPTPILTLEGVDLSAGGLEASAGQTRLELAIAPLLRGQLRFYEASIDSLKAALRPSDMGAKAGRADAGFDRIRLTNARIRVIDAGTDVSLEGLDLDGTAASITGPFNASGSFLAGGTTERFHLSAGALDNARMRLKAIIEETSSAPRAELDGALVFATGGLPAFDGEAVLAGSTPEPWRIAGPAHIDAAGAKIAPLEGRLGNDAASISAQGTASADFAEKPRIAIALSARDLDLDRLRLRPAGAALEHWLAAPAHGAAAFSLDLSLTSPAALLGGEPLTDIAARGAFAPGQPPRIEVSIDGGPGGSRLSLNGDLETGPAARFQGRLEFATRDLPRFADWLGVLAPEDAARLKAMPARAIEVGGDVALSAAGAAAKNLALKADRTTLAGSASFARATDDARARLDASLISEAFDIDSAPDLTGPARALADADLALDIDARAIRVARFGEGAIDAGHIRLRLTRQNGLAHLDELSIADLGGAVVRASGHADARAGALDVAVSADRLGDLAGFLRRVAPGVASDALAARATALSPASMLVHVDATRASPDAPLRVSAFKLDGTARGSKIAASARPEGGSGDLTGTATVDSSDAAIFARQIGVETAGLAPAGGARLDLTVHGGLSDGFDLEAAARIAGTRLTWKGRVEGNDETRGAATLDAPDAAPLLRLLGYGLADASLAAPARLAATLASQPGRLTVSGLTGLVAGATIGGDLAYGADVAPASPPRWSGSLRVDALSLPALAEVVLGPARQPKAGELWPSAPLAAGMARVPTADIALTARDLRLMGALRVADARLRVTLATGVVGVELTDAKLNDGGMSGRLTLRRDGASASALGSLSLDKVRFAQQAAVGVASGEFEASGSGESPASLLEGLAGQGKARIDGLTIPAADPGAPGRVLARAESGALAVSENDIMGALARELDAGPFKAGSRDFDATLAGGRLTLASAGDLSLAFDARAGTLGSRATLTVPQPPKDWSEPPPGVSVSWRAAPNSAVRQIDAGAFTASLTARALAREQARIEAFEADARERAYFSRQLKGFAFIRRREREIAAFAAEQARLSAEAERRAQEARKRGDSPVAAPKDSAADQPPGIGPPANAGRESSAPAGFLAPPPGVDPTAAGRY